MFSEYWLQLSAGKKSDGTNEEGLKFYKALIDELHKNGNVPQL